MKTLKETINKARRKNLRYIMHAKRDGNSHSPIFGEKEDVEILKYFESQSEFTSWEEFGYRWDIGIGDNMILQSTRPHQWHLFGIEQSKIVVRPSEYFEKEAERQGISNKALIQKWCNKLTMTEEEFRKKFTPLKSKSKK